MKRFVFKPLNKYNHMKKILVVLASLSSLALTSQNLLNNSNPQIQIQSANPMLASNISSRNVVNEVDVAGNRDGEQIQQQEFIQSDNNDGNQFVQQALNPPVQVLNNDQNDFQQKLSFDIPAIRLGNGRMNLSMPNVNLKSIKFSTRSSSTKSSISKSHELVSKWHKLNRKLQGKFSGSKKIHFKVDKCFKW
jgi:hypothetical protein